MVELKKYSYSLDCIFDRASNLKLAKILKLSDADGRFLKNARISIVSLQHCSPQF